MRGQCLCGAVSFEAEPPKTAMHACHCEMCRRWTGSALLAVMVPAEGLRLTGEENVRQLAVVGLGRARVVRPLRVRALVSGDARRADAGGSTTLPVGLFDEPDRFELRSEI